MKVEHIALASNTKKESDRFFIKLLGLLEKRDFTVSAELMRVFFGIDKDQRVIRYGNEELDIEVFITDDDTRTSDLFTHCCLIVKNRDKIVENATLMDYKVVKVPRKDNDNYYLFIKDKFGNLYEIKSQ
ncbi:MAG: VOC family protein [Candidatus Hodarchaeota archaeon]